MNFLWHFVVISLVSDAVILAACIQGVRYRALRREFVCFTGAIAFRIAFDFASCLPLAPDRLFGGSLNLATIAWFVQNELFFDSISLALFCSGFVFLMIRAFALSVMGR